MAKARSGVTVTIEGKKVSATLPEGQVATMELSAFIEKLMPEPMGTGGMVLPDGVKASIPRDRARILVHETPPAVHNLRWIADDSTRKFGEGTKYRTVKVSLPYVIVLAVYTPGADGKPMLSHVNEAYFRTAPLTDLSDELYYPALLNCSRFEPPEGHPLSWICTQHLDLKGLLREPDAGKRMWLAFKALLSCLFATGFNYSSEHHEASSWYTESTRVVEDISPIERWEEKSSRDPLFVLDQPWLPTGLSVNQVLERIFGNLNQSRKAIASARDVAGLIFSSQRGRRR